MYIPAFIDGVFPLLVACQGDVSRKHNQALPLVDSFNFNFVDEERSDFPDISTGYFFLATNLNVSKNNGTYYYSHIAEPLIF